LQRTLLSLQRHLPLGLVAVLAGGIFSSSASHADAVTQALQIHNRLAGVAPSADVLGLMHDRIQQGDRLGAASMAMNDRHFYSVTLKNFATPWTNRDQSAFADLNDYTTLVIGMVKDDVPFDQILYGDLIYVDSGQSLPSENSNAHYEALEERMMNPDFKPETEIVQMTQSSVYGIPANATAGAMTTRAASESFFVAGTNRAMLRFTMINHMCMDLEQAHDTSIVPDRIRQDVSRSPGADSRVFLNNCIGCHAGMDPLAQAFAYYDFNEATASIEYTPNNVQAKYFNNAETFADGFITPDDSWDNYWRQGKNALIGWNPGLPGSGSGAKSLGQELAGTQAFAQCQVKKVFKTVCLRDPVDDNDRQQVSTMTNNFENGYNLRNVFAESAVYCMGE